MTAASPTEDSAPAPRAGPPEGKVIVRVHWDGAAIRRCEVDSQRPVAACRTLHGREVGEALSLVPRLFSVCGQAQLAAACGAVDAAKGVAPLPPAERRRHLGLLGETVAEYLWRFLIDLPQAFGEEPVVASVASVRCALAAAGVSAPGSHGERGDGIDRGRWQAVEGVLTTVLVEQVFGMAPERFATLHNPRDWDDWLAAGTSTTAQLLGRLVGEGYGSWAASVGPLMGETSAAETGELAKALVTNPDFSRRPTLNGGVPETGALARNQNHPLVRALAARDGRAVAVRLAARLVEMARLAGELPALLRGAPVRPMMGNVPLAEGVGASGVETARGRLLHRVELADGLVRDWRVLAPTEWNFHPEGPLPAGLTGTAVDDEGRLRRGVRLAVLALDPCVAYDVEVLRA